MLRTTTDLVMAKQSPAELPRLFRGLGLVEPRLGRILMLHVWVKVQLVESLEQRRTSTNETKHFAYEAVSVVRNIKFDNPGSFSLITFMCLWRG